MVRAAKYVICVLSLAFVLIFSATAAAKFSQGIDTVGQALSEPLVIMLFGISLIGVASFVRK